jgi:hypothetical protein
MSAACGGSGSGDDDGNGDAGEQIVGFTLEPAEAELVVVNRVNVEQTYTATVELAGGEVRDVSGEVGLRVDDIRLGFFSDDTFTTSGVAGGRTYVHATYGGKTLDAVLTVRMEETRVDPSAPPNAPDLFDNATEDAALAPTIVYPSDGTYVPPNLGDFETHWTDSGGADLFEVTLQGEYSSTRLFVAGTPLGGSWAAFLPSEWAIAGETQRGEAMTVTVRGMNVASPTIAGTSAPIGIELTDQNVDGGIYYWAAAGSQPEGIYRHDMSRPGQPAEAFYTVAETPGGRCVACHALSRDGTRMALTYDGGNGAATILDVATRTPLTAIDGSVSWNFATYEPDGTRLVTVFGGAMSLRDGATGAVLGTVPTGGYASHPDFSPLGDAIAYVSVAAPGQDWHFTGGAIVTLPFDPAGGTWGTPTTLVPNTGTNVYYPSWSPDGQWIVFNRSNEDAYNDASAEMWIVKADGSAEPIKLDSPNIAPGLTNSWVRWAPFEQQLDPNGEMPEPLMWLTFSSTRVFGVRLAPGTPQVWMAPFFPQRAATGVDPSGPAFRLPFQELGTNNHIAQWTETVVPID